MKVIKINNDKFKGIRISINYTLPIVKSKVAEQATVASYLSKGCKKYTNQQAIDLFLSNLYGAGFDTNVEKIGDLYNIEFCVECVNKKFLPNKFDAVKKSFEFLYNIIYRPNLEKGLFIKSNLENEKRYILDKINQKKDDKLRYGVLRAEEFLCKDEPYGIYVYGNAEDVGKITPKSAYDTYINLITNAYVTAIIVGNLDGYDLIEQDINKIFEGKINNNVDSSNLKLNSSVNKVEDKTVDQVIEKSDVAQSVLSIGLKIKDVNAEDTYGFLLYNAILGDIPSSKLFQNVREKKSLAYAIRSRYYRYKAMFIIYAGIKNVNFEKAKTSIIEEIEQIKNGNVSKLEFDCAKQSIIDAILEWKDSKIALSKFALTNLLNYKKDDVTIDQIIDKVNSVTLEQVIALSKKVNVKLIYLLGGEQNA